MASRALFPLGLVVVAAACSRPHEGAPTSRQAAITSSAATILDFRFVADVGAARDADAREAIVSQLMYAQGVLMNSVAGNAHVGNVELTNIREERTGEVKRISYAATLPVAWPKDEPVPRSYELVLPRDAIRLDAFNAKYDGTCGQAEPVRAAFWFGWNPKARGCAIDPDDVTTVRATVAPSARETADRYPEYDLIWDDGRLDVVALFGLIESDSPQDLGYTEGQSFAEHVRRSLRDASVTNHGSGGWIRWDVTLTGTADVGGRARDVKVDVLVTRNLMNAGADFDERYDPLSDKADLIFYNGHSQLGEAVDAFTHRGKVAPGKYQLVLVDGCQSFAYLGTTLADRRRNVNGAEDPKGTRFLDVVANALPNPANNASEVSSVLFDAAVDADTPRSFRELLAAMPSEQMVVAFGEEDNRFMPPRPPRSWRVRLPSHY